MQANVHGKNHHNVFGMVKAHMDQLPLVTACTGHQAETPRQAETRKEKTQGTSW